MGGADTVCHEQRRRKMCVRGEEGRENGWWRLGEIEGWEWKNTPNAKRGTPIHRKLLGLGFLSGPIGLGWIWPKH
jgi:hypothetical protein